MYFKGQITICICICIWLSREIGFGWWSTLCSIFITTPSHSRASKSAVWQVKGAGIFPLSDHICIVFAVYSYSICNVFAGVRGVGGFFTCLSPPLSDHICIVFIVYLFSSLYCISIECAVYLEGSKVQGFSLSNPSNHRSYILYCTLLNVI